MVSSSKKTNGSKEILVGISSKTDLLSISRCNFKAYCVFSFLNTVVYSIPAGWVWSEVGFLNEMGVVDIAGSGPVHLVGGASGNNQILLTILV